MKSLKPLTDGRVTGVGVVELSEQVQTRRFGGALISADGVHTADVSVQKGSSDGEYIFSVSTKTSGLVISNFAVGGEHRLYYAITGKNAEAMFYEWV